MKTKIELSEKQIRGVLSALQIVLHEYDKKMHLKSAEKRKKQIDALHDLFIGALVKALYLKNTETLKNK